MGNQLQEILNEFACSIINYTNNKIVVDHFYSEERYNDFLRGINCRAGLGMFEKNEVLEFNRLNDNTLIIVKQDGVEITRYKYVPIFKGTLEYKIKNNENKKLEKRILSFAIKKNQFSETINFIDADNNSIDFDNVQAVRIYLMGKYDNLKLPDWSGFNG